MSARQRMTMRLYLQRNSAAANAFGEPTPPTWGALSTTPGYVWVDAEDTRNNPAMTVVSSYYRAIVPITTSVLETDRVEKVQNRAGSQLFGLMDIDAVIRRKDHLEIRLRGAA